jgi:putative ABC transport system permease protein
VALSRTKLEDFFQLALINFSHRRRRTMLTLIGIFIGIAAVVALVALGAGLQSTINREFQKIGLDKVTVMSTMGDIASPFASSTSANPLTEDDADLVKKVRGVKDSASLLIDQDRLAFAGEVRIAPVAGIPTGDGRRLVEEMNSLEAERGRLLKGSDGFAVVVGSGVAQTAFPRKVAVGDTVSIAGSAFKVVGIAKSVGDPARDSRVYVPKDTARVLFNRPKIVSMIVAQAEDGVSPSSLAEEIKRKIRAKRGEKAGEEDFAVTTYEQLAGAVSSIFSVLQAVLVGIAAISLIVGGIGIMNTMYTSVVERTREIGIMKAVGGRNSDIAAIFLIESGLLGMLGGIIGVILGVLIALVAEKAAEIALGSGIFRAAFSPELFLGALAFSFVVGAVSGVLPAMRASGMRPVDAIRQ